MNPGTLDLRIGSFLRHATEADPRKTCLIFRDGHLSYADFLENVNKASRAFQDLKIEKGDKVCLLLANCPEFLFAWMGLAQIGAVSVFINTALKPREVQYIVNHSEARAIVTNSALSSLIQGNGAGFPSLKHPTIYVDPPSEPGAISFQQALAAAPSNFKVPSLADDDIATFIYTSGTTGLPKAVMQTHRTYVLTGESIPLWLGLDSKDRLYTSLPLFHINAQAYSVMGSLGARASLILGEKFSTSTFWDQVRCTQATEVNLLGAMPLLLLRQPPKATDRQHQVRIAYTAPALTKETHEEFENRFGLTLIAGYGMSECTFGCINPLDANKRRIGSIGLPRAHPRFGNELRIIDDQDRDVRDGEAGQIALKNATIMKGYFKDPEATSATLRDGWLHTGDLAYKDESGFLYFAGRKKDMIRLKGENVSAYEVEVVINEHPGVQESAVVGIPADLGDEQVLAFVTPKPGTRGLEEQDIVDWCRARLAKFKVPSSVEFRENLPKTSTQKISKQVLREEAMAKAIRTR